MPRSSATIADFISGRKEQVTSLFEQILLICDQQGLLGKELFAMDGCKLSSNAAKEWSGTFEELKAKREKLMTLINHHVRKHIALDGDETELADITRDRIEKAVYKLNSAHEKIDEFLKSEQPRMGKGKKPAEVKSNITDNESAKMTGVCSCKTGIPYIPVGQNQ